MHEINSPKCLNSDLIELQNSCRNLIGQILVWKTDSLLNGFVNEANINILKKNLNINTLFLRASI